jgi:hypothetical protein
VYYTKPVLSRGIFNLLDNFPYASRKKYVISVSGKALVGEIRPIAHVKSRPCQCSNQLTRILTLTDLEEATPGGSAPGLRIVFSNR